MNVSLSDSLRTGARPLVRRCESNPILTASDVLGGATCVFNSGVIRRGDELVMVLNAWGEQWEPRFHVARSSDGVVFEVSPDICIQPPLEYPYVPHEGIFDTRITEIEGRFYVTYNVASRLGGRIRLAVTDDFEAFEDLGFITAPDHRNCVLFPEKTGGMYARLERPNVDDAGDIYLSYSPDLIHWGQSRLVLERNHRYWASAKVGPGAPPIRTEAGWLCIYHGARKGMNGYSYQAGAMLLDLDDPTRVVGNMAEALLSPEMDYERIGITPNVVFPTAAIQGDSEELLIYYGAADTSMALAYTSLPCILRGCLRG